MPIEVIYLNIDGVDESIEVDLHDACVEDVSSAFGFQALRRLGSSCVLSPKLKLKYVLSGQNSPDSRLNLDSAGAGEFS